ncbi:MAG: hypothetical protein IV100_08405 [Myxococcales bacterium]|nr:hypothetical protein [Myxococcales bacterium]
MTSFSIGRLENVFVPEGLPLVAKAAGQPPSTSVAIVGAAGTGKTTLGLAVAHAIASSGGGRTLVLLVESSPAEIVHKAALLGLPSSAIDSDGLVHVVTLPKPVGGDEAPTSGELLSAALDEVWQRVEDSTTDLPIRSVLLDGVLVEDGSPGVSRVDFASWVHGLEQRMGVSPVVIVESNDRSVGLHEFVCDVVFRLERGLDPESRQLSTQLLLTKSRHSLSLPGPHSYGVRRRRLEVWPDFAAVARGAPEITARKELPPILIPRGPDVPLLLRGSWAIVAGLGESTALVQVAVAAGVHVHPVNLAGLSPHADMWQAIDGESGIVQFEQWERASDVVRRTAEGLLRSAGVYRRQMIVIVEDVSSVVPGVDFSWVRGKFEPSPHSARAPPLDRSPKFFRALQGIHDLALGPPTERWLLEYISWCAIASRDATWWPVIRDLSMGRRAGLDSDLLKLVVLSMYATNASEDEESWVLKCATKSKMTREQQQFALSQCDELREVVER